MSDPGQSECGYDGNPDLYGLGIRIGIYLQTTACTAAVLFGQDRLMTAISYGNGIFQFALVVSLLILTTTSPEFQAVEAAIVVLLAICSSIQGFQPFPTPSLEDGTDHPRPSRLVRTQRWIVASGLPFFRQSMELILYSYSIWFWFVGLDRLAHSDSCTSFGFFFAPVDLYGWFRTLGKIYIIAETANQIFMSIAWVKIMLRKPEAEDGRRAPSVGPHSETLRLRLRRLEAWYRRNWQWLQGFGRVTFMVFLILSVELMIRWNQISKVSTLANAGQIIAFLVGFGGLISLLLDWDEKTVPQRV